MRLIAPVTPPSGGDDDVDTLRARLSEAHDTLRAIQQCEVDALVIHGSGGDRIYALQTPDEPYRDLVEQMQEGAVVLGVTGDILYCNARFANLVGRPLETVTGSRFDRYVHEGDRDAFLALLGAGSGRRGSRLTGSDAGSIEVCLSLTTTASEDIDRLSLIVTDLREIQEAVRTRNLAEENSRTKDEFLAMLAHELRNPIGALNTASQVLEETHGSGASATRARDVIARQVGRLSRLLDGLLDVARVTSGEIELQRRPLDLAMTTREHIDAFTGDGALDRPIGFTAEPVWVDGDPVRLGQVLTCLVTNAVQHTPPDGRILVSLRGDGDEAVLTVDDTGAGIAPDLLPSIFDTFAQGARTLDRTAGGLGIGLTLVRRLVELHGGTVVAASAGEGHGSRFTVRLRRIPAAAAATDLSAPPGRAEPRRVLLIEDNDDARGMMRLMLELRGHVVYDAADGVRGLAMWEAEDPDVVMVDIGLPGMDGYQVARQIRERQSGRAVLLLALTGYGRVRDRQLAVEAGFDHHLLKPIDVAEVARLLSCLAPPAGSALV